MRITGLHLLYSEEVLQQRVRALAQEIDTCYGEEPLVAICVLKGACMFFCDLVRQLHCKPLLDFIGMSSYGDSTCPGDHIAFTIKHDIPIQDKHVLIVEDIVDTGHSMHTLFERLAGQGARSLRLAALIDKEERRKYPIHVDFQGFTINEGFIVGYGLDYAEQYRSLPTLYTLDVA